MKISSSVNLRKVNKNMGLFPKDNKKLTKCLQQSLGTVAVAQTGQKLNIVCFTNSVCNSVGWLSDAIMAIESIKGYF